MWPPSPAVAMVVSYSLVKCLVVRCLDDVCAPLKALYYLLLLLLFVVFVKPNQSNVLNSNTTIVPQTSQFAQSLYPC